MTGSLMGRAHAFERGDKIYLTTPLTLATPTSQQVDEYAFASAVKTGAPNEHIGWLQGKYVEAERGNRNNQMWLSDELAVKALTPMLMPVTVMHDPRTAVGTIADCKLIDENAAARIENVLAIWRHRFPEVWEEAEANLGQGTMMQSMECLAPWYTCSECNVTYVKLPEGAEKASWCDHLRHNSSRRILGDVCFTGTGLIFGTRGGTGAYSEAHLSHFEDEIAEYHDRAHIDGTYRPSEGSKPKMATVTIEESELAALRTERDASKAEVATLADAKRDLTSKAEKAEADATKEKERADALEAEKKGLEEKAQAAQLKDKRWGELGSAFTAKLGEVTKATLQESAASLSDEAWDVRLKEVEELTGVKRADATETSSKDKDGKDGKEGEGTETSATAFKDEELASFVQKGVSASQTAQPTSPSGTARALARAFQPKPARETASTK